MYVARRHHRFSKILAQLYDRFVNFPKILVCLHRIAFFPQHKRIVAVWLYFQVIVKINNPGDLRLRSAKKHCLIQFSGFAGRAQQQPFPTAHQFAFGYSWPLLKIGKMRHRYQTIQIDPSIIVSRQYNRMVSRHLSNLLRRRLPLLIERIQIIDSTLCQHLDKFYKDLCRTLRVFYGTMMIF